MNRKVVVTISREYGSGGREVGRLLAEMLDIPFYDKELLAVICKESGIDKKLYEKVTDQISFANFYFGPGTYSFGSNQIGMLGELSLHDRLYNVQAEVIERIAKESCVIVGRCSDYILRNDPDLVKVFIEADLKDKKQRVISQYGEDSKKVEETLLRMDKRRANYYNYYSDRVWGKSNNYDIVVNTSRVGLANAAKVIKCFCDNRVTDLDE